MKIKLGEKIRELRRRDGRTQETLADAIGVTSQAVSRWEANGGYPDLEIVPAIANYFHITIDELFGYNGEREEKIKAILEKAEAMINAQGNMEPCVALLREAAEEFPSESKIMLNLGFALNMYGWQIYGARGYTKDDSDYAYADTEYNSKNEYFIEALEIFEKVLEMNINSDERMAVILIMAKQYANTGAYERAIELAKKQDSIIISRECLLPLASEGEDRDKYLGEEILALLKQLYISMVNAVFTKISILNNNESISKLLGLAHLYELVLDDGNCGGAHMELRDLYYYCAILEGRHGNLNTALQYFEKCFYHNRAYISVRHEEIFKYTAPLVSKVTFPGGNYPVVPENHWKSVLAMAPANLLDAIRSDERYAECFA